MEVVEGEVVDDLLKLQDVPRGASDWWWDSVYVHATLLNRTECRSGGDESSKLDTGWRGSTVYLDLMTMGNSHVDATTARLSSLSRG